MLFLVEIDHVQSGTARTPEAGRAFIEQVILPTITRTEQLSKEKVILAGGPVVGRIALRLIFEAESPQALDGLITSLPIWFVAETRVTPLIALSDRRQHVQALLERLIDLSDGE